MNYSFALFEVFGEQDLFREDLSRYQHSFQYGLVCIFWHFFKTFDRTIDASDNNCVFLSTWLGLGSRASKPWFKFSTTELTELYLKHRHVIVTWLRWMLSCFFPLHLSLSISFWQDGLYTLGTPHKKKVQTKHHSRPHPGTLFELLTQTCPKAELCPRTSPHSPPGRWCTCSDFSLTKKLWRGEKQTKRKHVWRVLFESSELSFLFSSWCVAQNTRVFFVHSIQSVCPK